MDELIRLRHELHRHPELSGRERETGKRIRFFLNRYHPDELFTGIAGEGMAAVYKGALEGPTLLFRCDLDGLPIQEINRHSYSSVTQGVSHACGHDGHMAMVSGLARLVKENPIKRGKVILFYQPEEENGTGALKSVRRLRELNLSPDYAFAIHNMPKYPMGSLILAEHTFAAASKGLIVKLIGRNSHAAYPEKGINPSLAVAEIVKGLSGLLKEKIYNSFVLITIVHIRVGEIAFGTSPGYGEVMCTLRAFDDSDMKMLTEKTLDLISKTAAEQKLAFETIFTDDFPTAVCDPNLTKVVKQIATSLGKKIVTIDEPNRWSEDFSHFMVRGPGIIMGLGAGDNHSDLHNPDYDFPDELIPHGIEVMDSIISHYLRDLK
jgi:amidohydrolase